MTTIIAEVPSEADVAKLKKKLGYRVVSYVTPVSPETPEKLRERHKWAGMLSTEEAAALRKHTEEVRNEQERDF